MLNEPIKIIIRRFKNRFMESGLLILALALGIGASSAGMSLLFNTQSYYSNMLDSSTYKEIEVSAVAKAEEMDVPLRLKPTIENAVLTAADLDAAEIIPAVTYAYVRNNSRLEFINETSIAEKEKRDALFPRMTGDENRPPKSEQSESPTDSNNSPQSDQSEPPTDSNNRPQSYSSEDLETLADSSDILILEIEEARGSKVTPAFFDAWKMKTKLGSLFSENDMSNTSSIIVLGSQLAEIICPEGESIDFLLGKKILTRDGLVAVIGILEEIDDKTDAEFFAPFRLSTSGFKHIRRESMNTQLRFTVKDPEDLDETAVLLKSWFDSQFGEDQVVISNPREEAMQMVNRNTGIGLLILFLSLTGLFIASVNVSNILMSRALRMKKHVGILIALGSSRLGIIKLFALEAFGLTFSGAVLGTFLSIPLTGYMQEALDISNGSWIFTLLGVIVSAILTLGFGLFPTRQFMNIDPAQAMRA